MKNRTTDTMTLNDYFAFVGECRKRVVDIVAEAPNSSFETEKPFDVFIYRDLAGGHESVEVYEVMLDEDNQLVFINEHGEKISENIITHPESVYPMALDAILATTSNNEQPSRARV